MLLTVNRSGLPDAAILKLARFARPHGCAGVELEVGQTKERYVANSYPYAGLVVIRVGFGRRFPYVHRHSRDELRRGYLHWGRLESAQELLLMLLAHELRHCWQAQRGLELCETDADRYALAVLARWRR